MDINFQTNCIENFSPSEGKCCTDNCKIVSADDNLVCEDESDCRYSTTCDGSQARCPRPDYKGNLAPCKGGTKVCSVNKLLTLYNENYLIV